VQCKAFSRRCVTPPSPLLGEAKKNTRRMKIHPLRGVRGRFSRLRSSTSSSRSSNRSCGSLNDDNRSFASSGGKSLPKVARVLAAVNGPVFLALDYFRNLTTRGAASRIAASRGVVSPRDASLGRVGDYVASAERFPFSRRYLTRDLATPLPSPARIYRAFDPVSGKRDR